MLSLSYLDLLEAGGRLAEVLGNVEALCRVDLGVDEPLLEVSAGGAETLIQKLLFALTLPARLQTHTAHTQQQAKLHTHTHSYTHHWESV